MNVPCEDCAIAKTQIAQQCAIDAGFAWPDVTGAFEQLDEEVQELRTAIESGNDAHVNEELGDVLFAAVALATYLGRDAGAELRGASQKFVHRWECMKTILNSDGRSVKECSLGELELLWRQVRNR